MASSKLFARAYKSTLNKSGKAIIFVRYSHKGRTTFLSSGESIDPQYWDKNRCRARKSFQGQMKLNLYLETFKDKIDEIVRDARIQDIEPTTSYVVNTIRNIKNGNGLSDKLSFFEFYDQWIEHKQTSCSPGTIRGFKLTKNHLKKYEKQKRIRIDWDTFNLNFYDSFMNYLYGIGNCTNTFGGHIKRIKIILNAAFDRKYHRNENFKSKKFKVESKIAYTIFLNEDELKKIYEVDFSSNSRLDKVRDQFIVACYTGLRFSDFRKIKPESVKDGFLEIQTKKTKQRVMIPWHSYVKEILEKWEYVLPPAVSNQKFNNYIKEVCQLAGLTEKIIIPSDKGGITKDYVYHKFELVSTHTARRSFSTNLFLLGFPSIFIMKITGHRTEKAFLTYIKIDEEQAMKKLKEFWGRKNYMNEKVMAS